MKLARNLVNQVGLGLRRGIMGDVYSYVTSQDESGSNSVIDFLEVAPENWIDWSGAHRYEFDQLTEMIPFVSHGLSLSLAGPDPLQLDFIKQLKSFLDSNRILIFSEHLSYCTDGGHLYDLMPVPLTYAMIDYVASRIMQVQDLLGRRIAIENVSYYATPAQELTELEFFKQVVQRADCDILLDVNNVYVNSVNHGYDAKTFIESIPTDKIAYMHIAGHYHEAKDLIIDTHGADVSDPVWDLLKFTYECHGAKATLLERDFNYPEFDGLLFELNKIHQIQENLSTFSEK